MHSATGFDIWLRMAEKRVLTDSESELSSSSEQTAGPSTRTQSAKKRKTMYKCKYSLQWTKTWPFIVAQPDDKHSFLCTVCSKRLSCKHQGVHDVKDQINSQMHQTLAKEALSQPKHSFSSVDPLLQKVRY